MIDSFLLIGQSNMSGRGELNEVEPIVNKNIFMFRDGEWITAKEPIHNDNPSTVGLGLAMSFCNELQGKLYNEIGVIPCAVGGTAIDRWKKGEDLYNNAVNATLQAMKNSNLRGILWHQGESDSFNLENVKTYKEKFFEMMNSFIADLGCGEKKIIIGELGSFLDINNRHWREMNLVFKEICEENNNYKLVSAEGLTDKGDFLHFDSKSLREFGLRYAKAWEEIQ